MSGRYQHSARAALRVLCPALLAISLVILLSPRTTVAREDGDWRMGISLPYGPRGGFFVRIFGGERSATEFYFGYLPKLARIFSSAGWAQPHSASIGMTFIYYPAQDDDYFLLFGPSFFVRKTPVQADARVLDLISNARLGRLTVVDRTGLYLNMGAGIEFGERTDVGRRFSADASVAFGWLGTHRLRVEGEDFEITVRGVRERWVPFGGIGIELFAVDRGAREP